MLLSPLASKLPIFRSSKWTISLFVSLQCFEGTQEMPLHLETQNLGSDQLKQNGAKSNAQNRGDPQATLRWFGGRQIKNQNVIQCLPYPTRATKVQLKTQSAAEGAAQWRKYHEHCRKAGMLAGGTQKIKTTQTFDTDKEKRKGNCPQQLSSTAQDS